MAALLDLVMAGKLRLIVDQVLPLSEAAEAHAHPSTPEGGEPHPQGKLLRRRQDQ